MDFSISSNIRRQSQYRFALGNSLKHFSAYFQSTSHRATMFSVAMPTKLGWPFPPIPMPATLSLSLGAVYPNPLTTWLGTMVIPEVAIAAFFKKPRRELSILDMVYDA